MQKYEIKALEEYLNRARDSRLGFRDYSPAENKNLEEFYLMGKPSAEDLFLSLCGELGLVVLWDFQNDKYELRRKTT